MHNQVVAEVEKSQRELEADLEKEIKINARLIDGGKVLTALPKKGFSRYVCLCVCRCMYVCSQIDDFGSEREGRIRHLYVCIHACVCIYVT